MGVLDDLEAALQATIDADGDSDKVTLCAARLLTLTIDHLPELLPVCRAAVAYQEAMLAGSRGQGHQRAIKALLAATEGLT